MVAAPLERDGDLALERELERVREQVQDDLLPHVAIDVDRFRERIALDDEPQARLLDRRSEDTGQLRGERRQDRSARSWRRCGPASMREKSSSVLTSLSSRRPLRWATSSAEAACGGQRAVRLCEQVLQRTDHQRERRPEFVGHVRKERRLHPVQLRERLGPPALFLDRLRICETGRNLRRNQLEEGSIVLVERAHRADGRDKNRARLFLAGKQDRQNDGRCRRGLPRPRRQRGETCRQIADDGRPAADVRPCSTTRGQERCRRR